MMLRLYMDVHVHGPITAGLRRRGVDVITAQEDGTTGMNDSDLLDRATALGRVMVSMDKDLTREATRRQRSGLVFGGVIFAEQLRITIGQAVDQLELIAKVYDAEEMTDALVHLPL